MRKIICIILTITFILTFAPIAASAATADNSIILEETRTNNQTVQDSDNDNISDSIEEYFGSDPYSADTDNDGVTDYVELFVTHTDFLVANGDIDTDEDGLTNAEECIYGTHAADPDIDGDGLQDGYEVHILKTNPLEKDTDGDELEDSLEIELGLNPLSPMTDGITPDKDTLVAKEYFATNNPNHSLTATSDMILNNGISISAVILPDIIDPGGTQTYTGHLYTDCTGNRYEAQISYTFNYSWFFRPNTTYYPELAAVSALMSANMYADSYIQLTSPNFHTTVDNSLENWMEYHDMEEVQRHSVVAPATTGSDWHVSEVVFGWKQVSSTGTTKNIIAVVIRGTNGTLNEWASNFDIGATSQSHSEWTTPANHRGFDITSNRILGLLQDYIDYIYTKSSSSVGKVLWITGHSRGGALANIVAAKRIQQGDTVFAYTFASPNTTTVSQSVAESYTSIFNIVNTDDYVPQLPMSGWNFRRYGLDRTASIADSYETEWEAMMTDIADYNPDTIGMNGVINALTGIANDRNSCYAERTGSTGRITMQFETETLRADRFNGIIGSYASNMTGTYRSENFYDYGRYGFHIYQKPTFLMQLLAARQGGVYDDPQFVSINVAPYLEAAKLAIASAGLSGMEHPHFVSGYYLLAQKFTS